MPDFSLSDLLSSAGTATGNFVRDTANSIADNYCGVYRDYPQFVVGLGFDPITPFRRALADSLCSGRDPGLPSPPSVPFSGGQCDTAYQVDILVSWADNAFPPFNRSIVTDGKFLGAAMERTEVPDQGQVGDIVVFYWVVSSTGNTRRYVEVGSTLGYNFSGFEILGVTRVDGNPDTCGDPPPDFPYAYPPPERRNPDISYPHPSGGNSFNFPVLFAPITNNLDINVPVDLDVDFDFNFDFGGVTFGDNNGGNGGDGNFTPDDRGTLGDAASNAGQAANKAGDAANAANDAADAANAAKDAANAAKDAADAAKRNTDPPPPPGSPETDEEDRPDGDNDRDGIEELLYVRITLTTLPYQNKRQFGEGSPDVFYAGWIEFKAGGFPLPRMQINFQQSLFAAPKGADGYAYCLTSGAEGYATEITRKIEV